MPQPPIYMDNHASTQVDPRVFEAMVPFLTNHFGNPASSNHSFGWTAGEAVERAREQIAALVNASPKEITFTSGATESDNTAIIGTARANRDKGRHIVLSPIEHSAVIDSCRYLEREGWDVTTLPIDASGVVKVADVEAVLREDTVLVSLMLANNEIGTVQPVSEVGAICRERGILLHTDVAQALGRIPVDAQALNADLMALTAHKMHGPKGIGALFVRRTRPRVRVESLIHGGQHERGLRSGTLASHQIVGFGKTAELGAEDLVNGEVERLAALRDRLWAGLQDGIEGISLNGSLEHRLPHNLNVSIPNVEGNALLMALRDIAVSSGSACNSANLAPSHVLVAIGVPDDAMHTSIRFGLGRFNTPEEVETVIVRFTEEVVRLRAMSPLLEAGL